MYENVVYLLLPVFILLELAADVSIIRLARELLRTHPEVYRRAGLERASNSMAWGIAANFKLPLLKDSGLPHSIKRKLSVHLFFRGMSIVYALNLAYCVLNQSA